MPEVHNHSVVLLDSTCSDDEEELPFRLRSGKTVVVCWITVSTPKDVSTIFRDNDVASVPAENGIPACTGADKVIEVPAPNRVFSRSSIQLVGAVLTMDVVMARPSVYLVLSFASIESIVSRLFTIFGVDSC